VRFRSGFAFGAALTTKLYRSKIEGARNVHPPRCLRRELWQNESCLLVEPLRFLRESHHRLLYVLIVYLVQGRATILSIVTVIFQSILFCSAVARLLPGAKGGREKMALMEATFCPGVIQNGRR
jgi:hypothetical protein